MQGRWKNTETGTGKPSKNVVQIWKLFIELFRRDWNQVSHLINFFAAKFSHENRGSSKIQRHSEQLNNECMIKIQDRCRPCAQRQTRDSTQLLFFFFLQLHYTSLLDRMRSEHRETWVLFRLPSLPVLRSSCHSSYDGNYCVFALGSFSFFIQISSSYDCMFCVNCIVLNFRKLVIP